MPLVQSVNSLVIRLSVAASKTGAMCLLNRYARSPYRQQLVRRIIIGLIALKWRASNFLNPLQGIRTDGSMNCLSKGCSASTISATAQTSHVTSSQRMPTTRLARRSWRHHPFGRGTTWHKRIQRYILEPHSRVDFKVLWPTVVALNRNQSSCLLRWPIAYQVFVNRRTNYFEKNKEIRRIAERIWAFRTTFVIVS